MGDTLVAETRQVVAKRLAGQQAGHGMDHILRVFRSACSIQNEVGGSRLVVQLAALLHDVGDAKFHAGVERSAEYSREILQELGAAEDVIQRVVAIVDNISFRKGVSAEQLSLEAKIVQDADRLDALGAIGIVRTIEYGASCGQAFYANETTDSHVDPRTTAPVGRTGVGHFHEKLFKLRSLLHTEPARRVAQQREQFMRDFLNQFFREWGEIV